MGTSTNGNVDRRGQEAEAIDNVQRGRGTELPHMRSLVLVAGGRQLVGSWCRGKRQFFHVFPVVLSRVLIMAVPSPFGSSRRSF